MSIACIGDSQSHAAHEQIEAAMTHCRPSQYVLVHSSRQTEDHHTRRLLRISTCLKYQV